MAATAERPGWMITCALSCAVGLLLFLIVDFLRERVSGGARYRVGPDAVRFDGVTDPTMAHQLHGDGTPFLDWPRSILDPELPRIIRQRVEARPWVREVVEVERRFPDQVSVAVAMRRPLAVLHVGIERLALDDEGVVLESDTPLVDADLPAIEVHGEDLEWLPVDGEAFASGAVQEAVATLRELRSVSDHRALESAFIDRVVVGERGEQRRIGDADVKLVLDSGVILVWGRSPDTPLGRYELPPRVKLDHLARVQRVHPGLIGVRLVDLRFRDPEVEPLTLDQGEPSSRR